MTVAAPSFFHGDLGDPLPEPGPEGSPLRLVALDARAVALNNCLPPPRPAAASAHSPKRV